MYGFPCYDNIAPNAKCQRVVVLALCLVDVLLVGSVLRKDENDGCSL